MIVQYFTVVFLLVLSYLAMCYSRTERPGTWGPFKTSVVSVNDCRNPSRPYSKNPPIIFYPLVENINGRNMLGGNLTVLKDTKDVKMKLKSYTWRDGKWHESHSFNNLDCHSSLLHFTVAVIKVKYDKKTCMFTKGFYSFPSLDVNQLQHIWVPNMPYGKMMWKSETFNKGGTIACKEFEIIAEPAYDG